MRVCAVIVTYNRPELLKRCVGAVLKQTMRPAAIVVVDNCSQMPAKDALGEYAKDVQVVRLGQNTGGAGGFHVGLAEAFRQGFDAAWLMDDDGMPTDGCLAALLDAIGRTDLVLCNPLVVDENSPEKLVFGLGISGQVLRSTQQALEHADSDGLLRGTLNPFNGTLVTRQCYERLGDIKYECFIWGDEEEYFERARSRNVPMATVVDAKFTHPTSRGATVLFGVKKLELKLCPPDRSHYYFRNYGFNKFNYRGILVAGYHGLNYLTYLLKSRQWSEAFKFASYYLDGAFNLYVLKPSRTSLSRMLSEERKS
jgi:rhamnopyranosyl-N-acetylglucosaminyl-diphospho-decaprenol beta-1,3/1,4-galactofuranosyltransferase